MGITRAGVAQLLAGTSIEVDAIESVVAGKADVADLSALSDRVTSAEETLGTRAEEAATQEALTTLGNRVTSAETAIGTKADAAATAAAIGAKADATATTNALAAKSPVLVPVVTEAGAFTIGTAHRGAHTRCTSAIAATVTVPDDAAQPALSVGSLITLIQVGSGQYTLSAAAGVSLGPVAMTYRTRAQGSSVSLLKVAPNVWDVLGDFGL